MNQKRSDTLTSLSQNENGSIHFQHFIVVSYVKRRGVNLYVSLTARGVLNAYSICLLWKFQSKKEYWFAMSIAVFANEREIAAALSPSSSSELTLNTKQ